MGAALRIEVLGGVRAIVAGRPVDRFQTEKAAELLAYLALAPAGRAVPRESGAEALWPDAPGARGRLRRRRALRRLRGQVADASVPADAWLVATQDRIGLRAGEVEVDALELEAAVTADAPAALGRAVDLYRGPLLPGCDEPWVD